MARKKKKEKEMKLVRVINGKLNIRKEPSLDSEIVDVLDDGTVVIVGEQDAEWYKIDAGYIMSKFTELVEETSHCDGNVEE